MTEQEQLRQFAARWERAAPELEAIRSRDNLAVSRQEAIRQLFTGMESILTAPGPLTSGPVEQQRWFGKIRVASADASSRTLTH